MRASSLTEIKMPRANLALVEKPSFVRRPISLSEKLADHQDIIQGYLNTHLLRNHSEYTIVGEEYFLRRWFEGFLVEDLEAPGTRRQLFVWEAMRPIEGRLRIIEYGKALHELCLKAGTIRGYMGILRRCFDYINIFPFIPRSNPISIIA